MKRSKPEGESEHKPVNWDKLALPGLQANLCTKSGASSQPYCVARYAAQVTNVL